NQHNSILEKWDRKRNWRKTLDNAGKLPRPQGAELKGTPQHAELGIHHSGRDKSRRKRRAEAHIHHFDLLAVLGRLGWGNAPQGKLGEVEELLKHRRAASGVHRGLRVCFMKYLRASGV